MGKAKPKQKPQPPKWFHNDTDGCWFCKNRNACGGCRILKKFSIKNQKGGITNYDN